MTEPRQPAYDAVFAYIRSQPRDFLPSTVVERNAIIWRAVNAALDAVGVAETPTAEQEPAVPGIGYEFRNSLLVLLSRVQRGVQSTSEADLLRSHIEHLLTEHDRLRRDNCQLLEDQAECIRLEAELQRLRTESPWLRATAEDLTDARAAIARVRALADTVERREATAREPDGASPGEIRDALDEPKEPTT